MRVSVSHIVVLRLAGVALLAVFYIAFGVFDHEIWPPTEPAFAGVVWSMLHTGNLLVPHINELPYLEKPPLAYVLSWAGIALWGAATPGLLRLPAALAGVGSVLIVFCVARRLYSESVAWLCAVLCALTGTFWGITHRASTDAVALFFTFACLGVFSASLVEPASSKETATDSISPLRSTRSADLLFCALLAVSFLVKNFYTFLLVVPPVTAFLLMTRSYGRLARIALVTSLLLLVIVIPWSYVLWHEGGLRYLRVVFFDNTIGRFTRIGPPTHVTLSPLNDAFVVHKDATVSIGLSALATEMLPWLLIQPLALWAFFRRRSREPWRGFLKLALVSMVVLLTLSASSVETYYRPAIFVLCLMSGEYLQDAYDMGSRLAKRYLVLAINLVGVALLLAAAPLGAAKYLGLPALAGLVPLLALGVVAALALSWARWNRPTTAAAWGLLLVVLAGVNLALVIPPLDATRSWRPFFDEVRHDLDPERTVWSTVIDDRHLPVMNFYLDRPLRLLRDPAGVPDLLRSQQEEGVIMTVSQFTALQPALAGLRHRVVRAPVVDDRFIYVDNGAANRPICAAQDCASAR